MSCARCGLPAACMCSACGGEKYCSRACQKKSWNIHKKVCGKCPVCKNAFVKCTCEEEVTCYICLERQGTLIQPCACLSYVHEDCVVKFVSEAQGTHCLTCMATYAPDVSYKIAEKQLEIVEEQKTDIEQKTNMDFRQKKLEVLVFRARSAARVDIEKGIDEYMEVTRLLKEWNAPLFAHAQNHMNVAELVFEFSTSPAVLDEVYDIARHAVKTLEDLLPSSISLADSYRIFAQLHIRKEMYLDALSYFCKAHRILSGAKQQAKLPFDLRVEVQHSHGNSLFGIARSLILLQRFSQAKQPLEKVCTLFLGFAGPNHPVSVTAKELLDKIVEHEEHKVRPQICN